MKKKMSILLCTLFLAIQLVGCQRDGQTGNADAAQEDTLMMAIAADIGTFDPSRMTSGEELFIGSCIYDSLTWTPLGAAEPTMKVAESYSVSDDGVTYSFTLRDGVTFHNGEKMTMDDVLYSVELFRTSAALASFSYSIADCRAENDKTLIVTLRAPDPGFLEGFNWCFILPKEAHETAGGDFGTQPIGSGPYTVQSYAAGDKLVLNAYSDYYRGKADIERCEIRFITDLSTVATALETGEIHYSMNVAFSQIETLEQSGMVTCEMREAVGSIFLYGVHQNPPYDNVLVRKAISYAIDRDMCSDVVYSGYAPLNPTPLPGITVDGPQEVEGYSYDPEKARQLLADAGYPGGEGLRTLTIQTQEINKAYAEVVQSNLRDIGIQAEVEVLEQNAFLADAFAGNVDLAIMTSGLGGNAAQWVAMFTTGGQMNFPQYSNPTVDELYSQAIAERDSSKRQELYDEIFRIVIDEDAAMTPIVGQMDCHAISTKLDIGDGLNNAYTMINPYDLSFRTVE